MYGLAERMKFIDEIIQCPLCSSPVCEAPMGSGHMACINWNCPYMTHYNWTKEDYDKMKEAE